MQTTQSRIYPQTHTHHPPTHSLSSAFQDRYQTLKAPHPERHWNYYLLINSKTDFHKHNYVSHSLIPLISSTSWPALCFPMYFLWHCTSIKSYPFNGCSLLIYWFHLICILKHLDARVKWEIRMCIPGVRGWKDATVNIRSGHLCRAHRRLNAAESMSGKEKAA